MDPKHILDNAAIDMSGVPDIPRRPAKRVIAGAEPYANMMGDFQIISRVAVQGLPSDQPRQAAIATRNPIEILRAFGLLMDVPKTYPCRGCAVAPQAISAFYAGEMAPYMDVAYSPNASVELVGIRENGIIVSCGPNNTLQGKPAFPANLGNVVSFFTEQDTTPFSIVLTTNITFDLRRLQIHTFAIVINVVIRRPAMAEIANIAEMRNPENRQYDVNAYITDPLGIVTDCVRNIIAAGLTRIFTEAHVAGGAFQVVNIQCPLNLQTREEAARAAEQARVADRRPEPIGYCTVWTFVTTMLLLLVPTRTYAQIVGDLLEYANAAENVPQHPTWKERIQILLGILPAQRNALGTLVRRVSYSLGQYATSRSRAFGMMARCCDEPSGLAEPTIVYNLFGNRMPVGAADPDIAAYSASFRESLV